MGEIVKTRYNPNIVTSLINGLVIEGKINDAVGLLNKISEIGFQLDVIRWEILIKELCRIGNTDKGYGKVRWATKHGYDMSLHPIFYGDEKSEDCNDSSMSGAVRQSPLTSEAQQRGPCSGGKRTAGALHLQCQQRDPRRTA
ncbi:helicase [Abeliophyllum distichum]|uniref:Helicase n=1 Tax=Abeliophyllum distichum TaxID=126358 RepID=A0ABD1VA57_9LAMI